MENKTMLGDTNNKIIDISIDLEKISVLNSVIVKELEKMKQTTKQSYMFSDTLTLLDILNSHLKSVMKNISDLCEDKNIVLFPCQNLNI